MSKTTRKKDGPPDQKGKQPLQHIDGPKPAKSEAEHALASDAVPLPPISDKKRSGDVIDVARYMKKTLGVRPNYSFITYMITVLQVHMISTLSEFNTAVRKYMDDTKQLPVAFIAIAIIECFKRPFKTQTGFVRVPDKDVKVDRDYLFSTKGVFYEHGKDGPLLIEDILGVQLEVINVTVTKVEGPKNRRRFTVSQQGKTKFVYKHVMHDTMPAFDTESVSSFGSRLLKSTVASTSVGKYSLSGASFASVAELCSKILIECKQCEFAVKIDGKYFKQCGPLDLQSILQTMNNLDRGKKKRKKRTPKVDQ